MKKRKIVSRCLVLLMLIATFAACASTRNFFGLGLSEQEKNDVVAYLKSL